MCVRNLTGQDKFKPVGDFSKPQASLIKGNADLGIHIMYPPLDNENYGVLFELSCGIGIGEPVLSHKFDADSPHGDDFAHYLVLWATDAVCSKPPPSGETICQVEVRNGPKYDLSPLIRTTHNWYAIDTVENNKYRYEINICRPLVLDATLDGTDCAMNGSSICQSERSDGKFINHMSLGWSSRPTYRAGTVSIETKFVRHTNSSFIFA